MLSPSSNKKTLSARIGRRAILVMFGYGMLYFSAADSQSLAASLNSIKGAVTIIDQDGKELEDRSNVVVFIDGITTHRRTQDKQKPPIVSHQGRQFSPHVIPIVKKSTLDFFNDDSIYHNVFSLSKAKTFDLGIYPQGTSKLVTFNQPGLIKIYCNIHPKMVSNILVLNNTLFTKTGVDGNFKIKNIPDGKYTLRVWYEFSDGFNEPISFQGGNQLTKNLAITVTKKVRGHKNKFGKPYRKKY